MRILQLVAENIKGLKAVEITPKGDLVQLTGRNGQGKSSVLDAIWCALGGASVVPGTPIRQGHDSASVKLDLGEFVVTRTFTLKDGGEVTTKLEVRSAAGGKMDRPQTLLDGLLGSLTFDPLAFTRMKPKERAELLRGMVPLEVDFLELDRLNAADFSRRADVKKEALMKSAQMEGLPINPVERVDVEAIAKEIKAAQDGNASLAETRRAQDERVRHRARLKSAFEHEESMQADYRAEFERKMGLSQDQMKKITDEMEKLDALVSIQTEVPADTPVEPLLAKLQGASATNQQADAYMRRTRLGEEVAAHLHTAVELTERMTAREEQKAQALANAAMPVPGLSFTADDVLFNGIPLDQASSAEQLRVSCGIAMAANPKLRVLRIQDGSLLDEAGLELLASMAAEQDYQVWIERVESSGQVGIVIEGGQVVADHQEAGA